MLRYLSARDLPRHPRLAHTMFRDRAVQFRDRLGWPVTVDDAGEERDDYDACDPLYILWEDPGGRHGGSLRFLPMTGRTMVAEHFAGVADLSGLDRAAIWECTRFCLAPGASGRVAAALMLAGGECMRAFGVRHFLGVFDRRMSRVYRAIGSEPRVLGWSGAGRDRIGVGLWSFDPAQRARLLARSGLSSELSERWFARSFGFPVTAAPRPAAA